MLDVALKLLKELTNKSFKAYIVGGFVRDNILGIESNDIDITTNATPKEIKEIFEDSCVPNEEYGSVIVNKKGIKFEITTFRKEIEYNDKRRPIEIKYIDDLYTDLLRRDFVINTLCIDEKGRILDYLGGQEDIEKKIIRCVGDADSKFKEDSLRILRAIRFATILDFELSDEIIKAIHKNKSSVSTLSYQRKKNELDKIFSSPNRDRGIRLLLEFGLQEELDLPNLSSIIDSSVNSSIGIWSILNNNKYPFNKNELDLINNINEAKKYNNLDPYILYKYGLYVNSCAGSIKGIDLKKITASYNNLVIKSRDEIDISSDQIMNLLDREPGKYLKDIYEDIEKEILYRRLDNKNETIMSYINGKYR
jgi:tRNA nucleotidyltransferase (CCA-adding enzyme)